MAGQNLTVEAQYAGGWVDVTGRTRTAAPVTINRGGQDEGASAKPGTVSLRFDNRDGWALPTNPISPFYDTAGRYAPIRCSLTPHLAAGAQADVADAFGRTSASGWGNATSGQTWSTISGGSGAGTDFTVGSGQGGHYVDAANEYRATYLGGVSYADVDITVTVTAPQATGANLEVGNIMYRGQTVSVYGLVRMVLTTGNAVQVNTYRADSGAQLTGTYNTGITHAGTGTPIHLRVRVVGKSIMVKAWTGGVEPSTFPGQWTDPSPVLAGWVGLRTGRATSNTNTANPTATYDNFAAVWVDTRFSGEINTWTPGVAGNFPTSAWLTGTPPDRGDAWTDVEAAGILHRLNAGADPIRSALYRRTMAQSFDLLAYWPLEDPPDSAQAVSAIGGPAMKPVTVVRYTDPSGNPVLPGGAPRFGGETGPSGSAPLADLTGGGTLAAPIPGGTGVFNGYAVDFVLRFAPGNAISSEDVLSWRESGTYKQFVVNVTGTSITVFHANAADLAVGGFTGSATANGTYADGALHHVRYVVVQDSGNYFTALYVDGVLKDNGDNFGSPMAGTVGPPRYIEINPGEDSGQELPAAIGHITVWDDWVPTDETIDAAFGYVGEAPADRFARLCEEEEILHEELVGGVTRMGPQRPATLVQLLNECAATEDGILYEPRSWTGLVLLRRAQLYNQTAALTRAYGAGGVRLVVPVIDGKDVRNDVTVSNATGEEAHDVKATGTLGVSQIGRVTDSVSVNLDVVSTVEQLAARAGWEIGKGTIPGSRYPRLVLDLLAAPDLTAAAAAVEIGSLVAVTGLEADPISQIIRGTIEQIGYATRTIALLGTPATVWNGGVYDTAVYDSGTSTLAAGIDADDTALSVATTTAGDLWKTGGGFSVLVGGERMTVTASTGASSPQAFTVTRSANGVVKAHPAGTEVHVYPQARYAL